jgi:hypothetical protein
VAEPPDDVPISLAQRRIARDSPDDMATFEPILSFEGRSSECKAECKDFVFGYEAGLLGARLDARPTHWTGTYHAENLDMLRRVADAKGYSCIVEPSGDPCWAFISFEPKPEQPRLKLVPKADKG